MVENKYNIQTPGFLDILRREENIRSQIKRYEIGIRAWNGCWDALDRILAAKKKYEAKYAASHGIY